MTTARAIAEQAYAAMGAGNLSELKQLCAPTCELYDLGMTFHGPEQIGQYLQAFFTAFPNFRLEVRRLVADDHAVAAAVRFTGTHTGPLAMPTGEVPPTGRTLDLDAADFLTIEAGQITSWRVYLDSMAFMRQLGLLPEPESAPAAAV